LRLSWSSGYRAPQTYDEDLHVTAVSEKVAVIHNVPGLRPEYSHSVSGSFDLYHNFGRLQTNLLVEGFYTDIRDAFDLVTVGETDDYFDIERQNSEGVRVAGVNLEAILGIPRRFEFQAGFTWQRSRYKEHFDWAAGRGESAPQRRMFRSPDTYGYFTARVDIMKNFTGSLFGTYTGPMLVQHTLPDGLGGEIFRNEKTRSFFDAGLKLAYIFRLPAAIALEINGGVKNIFDSYQPDADFGAAKDAGYVYGPTMPRMYFVGAKFML
jgi:outer membrane receptor for ferrienterochelin and colicins